MDRILFHLVNTIGDIFTSAEINFDLSLKKKKKIFCLFHGFNPF